MSFIDKISANVTNAGKIVSQKAKNMADANTLTSAQRTEKRNIQDTLFEIGKLYYEKHKNDPEAEFAEQIMSILTSEKRIDELQTEIEMVRAREPELVPIPEDPVPVQPAKKAAAAVCTQCGCSCAANETVCPNCGQKLAPRSGVSLNKPGAPQTVAENWYTDEKAQSAGVAEAPAQPGAARFCAYCGKPCEAEHSFCASCGKKL